MASKDDIFGKDAKKEAMSIKQASDSETSNSGSGKRANKLSGRKQTLSGESGAGNVRTAGGKVANVKGTIDGKAVKQPSIFQKIGTGLLNVGKKALGNVKDALIQKGLDLVSNMAISKLIKCGSQGKYIDPTLLVAAYKLKNWVIQKERLGFKDKSIDFEKGLGHDAIDVNAGRKGRFPTRFGWPLVQKGLNILGSTYDNYVQYLDAIDNSNNNNRYGNLSMKTYTDYAKDDYKGINVYGTLVNTFPDDLGALNDSPASNDNGNYGAASHTWGTNYNSNSIMAKTKRLFRWNKINTVISRFSTFNTGSEHKPMDSWDVGTSEYGLSHGRNLLKREAELNGGNSYLINGYNNPYCRVWTHHYQMDNIAKLIRPFTAEDGTPVKKESFHQWENFKPDGSITIGDKYIGTDGKEKLWGWKNDTDSWKHSVLNDNGFVQIAPYRDRNTDGKANIHTKDCMFSIENLAWKGYDPYQFEKALSWEQRGGNGGRIMWFPPYGIQFNESTSVNWNQATFIGRGEPVYTYANTVRQGNLTFLMVVDHPSVLDYCTWYDNETGKKNTSTQVHNDYYDKNIDLGGTQISMADADNKTGATPEEKEKHRQAREDYLSAESGKSNNSYDDSNDLRDTDILRFLAGCGYDVVLKHAKPTPLTDEYVKIPPPTVQYMKPPKEIVPPDIPEKNIEMSFFIFYPNNYSGCYDMPTAATNHAPASVFETHKSSKVHAIAYLMNGIGAQKKMTDTVDTSDPAYGDVPLDFQNPYSIDKDGDNGIGYEMRKKEDAGISNFPNFDQENPAANPDHYPIVGSTKKFFQFDKKGNGTPLYKKGEPYHYQIVGSRDWNLVKEGYYSHHNIWYYRIDGNYRVPVSKKAERFANTFDQILPYSKNYADQKSIGLNADADVVKAKFPGSITVDDEHKLYSLLEVAYALRVKNDDLQKKLKSTGKYKGDAETVFGKPGDANSKMNLHGYDVKKERIDELVDLFAHYDIVKLEGFGYSNSHGANKSNVVNNSRNYQLALQRINTGIDWLEEMGVPFSKDVIQLHPSMKVSGAGDNSVDNDSAKNYRCAKITISFKKASQKAVIAADSPITINGVQGQLSHKEFAGGFNLVKGNFTYGKKYPHNFTEIYVQNVGHEGTIGYVDFDNPDPDGVVRPKGGGLKQIIWVVVPDGPHKGEMVMADKLDDVYTGPTILERNGGSEGDLAQRNAVRYDQEYYFFRTLEKKAPLTYNKLMDKLRYFDPAFHSMTPEGFNARLTFLQQCTRQGATIGASDNGYRRSADNLAFGRPPICILRLGDFFRTQIVINNLNINYEGPQWDLNEEGIGVQPLIAQVNISFSFIGGMDITSAINRLQNAVSFNYYANTRFYDNRADRQELATNSMNETEGGMPQTNFGVVTSYTAYNVGMSSSDKDTNEANTPTTEKTVAETDKSTSTGNSSGSK